MSRYLGELIERRRKELAMSLQDVADRTGWHKSYIGKLEKGDRRSPLEPEQRRSLAQALSIPVRLIEEAILADLELSGPDVRVTRAGRKATVVARVDDLPDDDVALEMIERMLDAGVDQARRRRSK
jgi:transcriptional regulator with XRE-family HTH domain